MSGTQKLAREDLDAINGGYLITVTSDAGVIVTGQQWQRNGPIGFLAPIRRAFDTVQEAYEWAEANLIHEQQVLRPVRAIPQPIQPIPQGIEKTHNISAHGRER